MKKKILIADDEEDIKEVLQVLLESSGYDIVTAYDGLDALDKVVAEVPDLVLLDAMMPMVDGFEVCQKIRQDTIVGEVPVIMLSASSEAQSRDRAEKAGANAYMTKPFDPDELLVKIRAHLRE